MPNPNSINPRTGKRYNFVDPQKMAETFDRQLEAVKRQEAALKARDDLLAFTKFTMPDPEHMNDVTKSKYEPAEFHKLIAKHLEDVEKGNIKQLIFCMPPRHGKSALATISLTAWYTGRHPDHDVIVAAAGDDLATDFGANTRAVIQSPQFKQVFPNYRLRKGGTAKDNIQTDKGGRLVFSGRGGQINGRGAHLLLIDDLYRDDKEARSQTIRDDAWNWFTRVALKRRMGQKLVIITMTRWHSDDIIGRLTDPENPHYNAQEAAAWKIIRLPGLAEEDDPLGRKPGEPLWPERYDLEYHLADQRRDPLGFAALVQQRPSVADGTMFRRETLQYYKPEELPSDLRIYCSSDHAVGTNQRNDPSCFIKVGVDQQSNIYLLDCIWERMPTDVAVERMLAMAGGSQKPLLWWAERGHISKSIGPFLHKRMLETGTYINLVEVTPAVDKATRAQSIAARVAMGKVYFPKVSWWTERAVNELLAFPNGTRDDFCLVAETPILMADGREKPIASIRVGDLVETPNGPKTVIASGMTSASAEVFRVTLSDGRTIDATGSHPIFVEGRGFVPVDTLAYNDVLFVSNRRRQRCQSKWSFMQAHVTAGIQRASTYICERIFKALTREEAFCIATSGRTRTGQFPTGTKFTTETKTRSTTRSTILSLSKPRGTEAITSVSDQRLKNIKRILKAFGTSQLSGTKAMKAENGIPAWLNGLGKKESLFRKLACAVRALSTRIFQAARISAGKTAVTVISVEALTTKRPVYNLTVQDAHVYFANGVLTHNCDALAYIGLGLGNQFAPGGATAKPRPKEGSFQWLRENDKAWERAKRSASVAF